MIVTDLLDRTEMLTDCNEISIVHELGGEHTIEFVVLNTERNAHAYHLVQDDSLIMGANETFVVKDLEEGPYAKSVIALNEFFECNDDYVKERWPDGLYGIQEALQLAFSTSDWSYAIDGNYPQKAKLEEFGNDNPVSMLNKILSAFNSEYEIDSPNKRVIVKRRLGVDTDFQIRDRHNIKAIGKGTDSKNVKTAVEVFYNMDEFGNYNNSVIYYSPNRNKYRKTKWREPIYSDTITTESQAIATARLVLQDEPDVTFSVEFTTLQEMGYNSNDVQLGNGVYLIDERMGLESSARIVAIREFYKLVNGQLVKDLNRSPIATISNLKKTVSRALVQQQKQQVQIERTAVKQQKIYNGCTITKEDGFKATAINGITAFLNATEGIAILNGEVYKFYVNPQGELVLDGRLYITKDGGTPLFDAYSDDAGGILKIFDKDGKLNVAIGSNFFDTMCTGGALKLYNDGSNISDRRVELGIYREDSTGSTDGEAGFMKLSDGNDNDRIIIEGVSYSTGETRILLRNEDRTAETEIIAGAVYVDGEPLAKQEDLDAIETELKDLIRQEIRDLKDYVDDEIDWVYGQIPSGD